MRDAGAALRRSPVRVAVAISALLSAVHLIWQPRTLDLSAQVFRAELWERHGWVLWNDAWYSGHTIPGYSLLYPPLGAWLGHELLGVVCSIAAAALFATIARRAYGERAWLGSAWFGAASTIALFGGRITFALGVALGLAAMLAIQRRRPGLGALAGALAGLSSPVAGLFTALAAGAVLLGRLDGAKSGSDLPRDVGSAVAVAVAATVATLTLALLFPTPGFQPFNLSAFVPLALASVAALRILPGHMRVLRWGFVLYALVGVAALAFDTPLGGNVVRLGTTFALAILALALFERRNLALALVALPLVWWSWTATVRDVAAAQGDPSTEAAYYEPLLTRLEQAPGEVERIHVPPTRNRGEAVFVAPRFSLARGWLRQLETDDITLFTNDHLTAFKYAQWLYEHGVAYVALPDAELDYLAEDEAELIESGDLPYLQEVWFDEHWRLFEVRSSDGTPPAPESLLASGGAEIAEIGPDGFTVSVPGPGDYLLALRYSSFFELEAGLGCLEDAGGASTRLTAEGEGPQTIEVAARLSAGGLFGRGRACSG